MNITVLGSGYVGLVTAVCLAEKGLNVTCVDNNVDVVKNLKASKPQFYEEGLEDLLKKNINKQLNISTLNQKMLENSDVILLAVGTPSIPEGIDLSQVMSALGVISEAIKNTKKYISVVVKSTVLPSTTDKLVKEEIEKQSGKKHGIDFGLGMNPEFLKEGSAVNDFMYPDRIVVGYEDEKTKIALSKIYSNFNCEILYTNSRTAELIKYVNNSLLAIQISINNEFANIAQSIGNIDYIDVIKGVSLDNRWSVRVNDEIYLPKILDYFLPGYGYGGSCFPKDVHAFYSFTKSLDLESSFLKTTIDVNQSQTKYVKKILSSKYSSFKNRKVLILGTSFKPNTDDIRNTVTSKIAEICNSLGLEILIHDPLSSEKFKDSLSYEVEIVNNWQKYVGEVDAVILATSWSEYKNIEKPELNQFFGSTLLIDARGYLDKNKFKKNYYSLLYKNDYKS